LLADFGADVAIVWVEFREFGGVGVDVGESEFGFAQGLHDLEYVEGPASFFCLQFFQGAKAVVGGAHFTRSVRSAFAHDGDASVHRNFVQQDIAADPSGTASGGRERRAAFDGGKREREMRNEDDGTNGPGGQIVVQDVEIGSAVGEDGALHLREGGIENFLSERFGLAL